MAIITGSTLRMLVVASLIIGSGNAASESQATDTSGVTLGTEAPGPGYHRLAMVEGFADGSGMNCVGPRYDKVLKAARAELRRAAKQAGADYVRVLSDGPLAGRNGNCTDNFMRLGGVAYIKDQ